MEIKNRIGPKTDPWGTPKKHNRDWIWGLTILDDLLTASIEPGADPLMGVPSYPILIEYM